MSATASNSSSFLDLATKRLQGHSTYSGQNDGFIIRLPLLTVTLWPDPEDVIVREDVYNVIIYQRSMFYRVSIINTSQERDGN